MGKMFKRIIPLRGLISIDQKLLYTQGISKEDVNRYIPEYILSTRLLEVNFIYSLFLKILQFFISLSIRLLLRPRKEEIGNLEKEEVDKVYNREAFTYDQKHHLTTRGQDTVWRRQAAHFVLNCVLNKPKGRALVLDLCTGTGLTIKEIVNVLSLWDAEVRMTGLDYNLEMLAIAKLNIDSCDRISVDFVRGDAVNMVGCSDASRDFAKFKPRSFDAITQVFGIGGISQPLKVFTEVLQLLKENGQFFLIDVHRPILNLAGEWPFLGRWLSSSLLEVSIYEEVTIPLALNRLWAWRDTTALFYLIRLIAVKDLKSNKYHGFRVLSFEYEPQRWWLSLPIMPIAKIILQKIELSEREAETRKQIRSACSF